MIAALLLAAGASRRFGGSGIGGEKSKLVEDLNGKPIVRWSAEALIGASRAADEVIAVVPSHHASIRHALADLPVRFVVNSKPERGIASSIACGIAALAPDVEAALITLGDEPTLSRDAVTRVVRAYREGQSRGVQIVAPTYNGMPGHPTLFARSVFDELRALSGDRGAREVIDRHRGRVTILELGVAPPGDVDTPDDLARMRRRAYIPAPTTSPTTKRT